MWCARRCSLCITRADGCSWTNIRRGSRSRRSRPEAGGRPRGSSRSCRVPEDSSVPSCGLTFRTPQEANAVSRPTPDRPDEIENVDEDLLTLLISQAGDPKVEPRPEHVASLRALLLDRLGPPRAARSWRTRLLVGSGLAAACLLGVLAWPRHDPEDTVPSPDTGRSVPQITLRLPDDASIKAAWLDVRRGLDVSGIPTFSWPIQELSPVTVSTTIPPDLLY